MSDSDQTLLERVPTGIAGLDTVLRGGLLQAGCYLVLGAPGAGKTILGSHIAFAHTTAGGRALYFTLLTESHSRLLAYLQSFSFFNPQVLTKSLFLISGYQELEKEKLKGLLGVIRQSVKDQNASLLVVDGVATAGMSVEAEIEFKKFIYELKSFVEMVGCTVLLLTGTLPAGSQYPAQTMVDGIIELSLKRVGMRTAREIEVVKFRGSEMLGGAHYFDIKKDGIVVYPRIEAAYSGVSATTDSADEELGFGVSSLDAMLGGGLAFGSTTLVLGTPGSGKTLLGLRFLAQGLEERQAGIYLGFHEEPGRIIAKASGIGLNLGQAVGRDALQVLWKPPFELIGDQVAEDLLDSIRRHRVKRLVLDGIEAFVRAQAYPDRAVKLLGALARQLRVLGVTTLFTQEVFSSGDTIELPRGGETGLADNVLLLRYVEQRSRLRRLISVLKKREGNFDTSLHEFLLTDAGVDVIAAFTGTEPADNPTAPTKPAPSPRPGPSGKPARPGRPKRTRR